MKTFFIFCFALILSLRHASAGQVRVQGTVAHAAGESLQCVVISKTLTDKPVTVVIPLKDGKFSHEFELSETTLLSFGDGANYFGGFAEPGDSIFINYDRANFRNTISYSGKGKEKFEIASAIAGMKGSSQMLAENAKTRSFPVNYMFAVTDSLKREIEARIDLSAQSVSADSRRQLLGHLAAAELLTKHNSLIAVFGDSYENILVKHRDKLDESSIQQIGNMLRFEETYNDSRFYVDAVKVLASINIEENFKPDSGNFVEWKYRKLAEIVPGKLHTPVLYLTLLEDIRNATDNDGDPAIRLAMGQLTDQAMKQRVADLLAGMRLLKEGDKAPAFSVVNLAGERVDLAHFQGKTIYLDFWFAGCGPCHQLFKSIEPVKKHFENDARVVFLTVSIDAETTWKRAIRQFGVKGYHVFTENKLREHPMLASYNVVGYPSTYIIDPGGRIHSVKPAHNPEVLRKQIEDSNAAIAPSRSR